MKLVFATNNQNKLKEVQQMLPHINLVTLKEINCLVDIPETADTISGNASMKSEYIQKHYQLNCFSDDTGLEVNALNGEPGVYSARYAGSQKNAGDNMDLLLKNLENKTDRSARFITVISLLLDGEEYLFEGICEGTIIQEKRGALGFGYDPIFVPKGYYKTFAEMNQEEKATLSHRGKAVRKLVAFLNEL
ncbi:MAG: non-canonical purine NTP diphosphatase [Flavobacteriaceae bacterium]|nr:non-canonical purine NTP diphosphatase [Flavobacteriaceae bacterium]